MLAIGIAFVSLALGVFNLLMLFAVLNRLKEHGARPPGSRRVTVLPAGTSVQVPGDGAKPTLVAFFAPGCPACEKLLPVFTEVAARAAGAERVAMVIAAGLDPERYRVTLGNAGRLITGPLAVQYVAAFEVIAFPIVYALTPDGVVRWSARDSQSLTALSANEAAAATA